MGRTVLECLPEVEQQGFIALLDRVYATGEAYVATSAPVRLDRAGAPSQELRYLDFVYEPMLDAENRVTGIFVQGHDVTERALATLDLRDTLESIADGFMACDGDWKLVYSNAAAEQLLGFDLSRSRGETVWHLIPGGPDIAVEAEFRRAAAGDVREFEYHHGPSDRWFFIRCYPRARGGVTVSFEDATQRKRAELLLRTAERRERERAEEIETIMRHVPAAIWIAQDASCEVITGNPQSYALIRMDSGANASASAPTAEVARPFREYRRGKPVPPADLPIQRAARTGAIVPASDIAFVFDDGVVRHVFGGAAPLYDTDGRVRGAVGAFVDVTELRESEEKLIHRERELRTLADNTPDILARFDRQHRCVFINAAVERITGHPAEDFIGKTNREMGASGVLADAWDSVLEQAFTTLDASPIEIVLPARGSERHFLARVVPELGPDGEVQTVLAIAQDVTDRKHAEAALTAADRRKDEFLATLAHELRNPLAPLRNGLEILELTSDQTTVHSVRSMMRRQLTHLVRLIDDLLEVSRITSGKVALHREVVDLRAIVELAVEASRPAVEAGGHSLEIHHVSSEILVDADSTRMAQVISNLLNNAAKYTPEGGRISLRISQRHNHALIRVADNGVGIPRDMLSQVFEMFAQIDQTLQRSQGGLGIGLALAKSIVELHGGSIEARSAGLGKGSVFTCQLPTASRQTVG